jgi:hypothetical protein
MREAANSR